MNSTTLYLHYSLSPLLSILTTLYLDYSLTRLLSTSTTLYLVFLYHHTFLGHNGFIGHVLIYFTVNLCQNFSLWNKSSVYNFLLKVFFNSLFYFYFTENIGSVIDEVFKQFQQKQDFTNFKVILPFLINTSQPIFEW